MTPSSVERITLLQLFALLLLFEVGSAIVVGVRSDAKQDAWIAVLAASVFGVAIIRMYIYILSYDPSKHLFQIVEAVFGKAVSLVLTLAYVPYFLYIAARVLRDFTELMITDTFPNTPIEALSVLFMLVVVYVVYLGIEVVARTTEVFVPYALFFLFMLSVFLFVGKDVEFKNMLPILAEGFQPVLRAVFPGLIGFPFGETIVFTLIMTDMEKFNKVSKTAMWAVLVSGAVLAYHMFLNVAVLGVDKVGRSTFPFLNAVREIAVAEFIERLDPFVVFIMMLGIFVKVCLFFYGGLKGLEHAFRIPYRCLCFPIGMLVALVSVLIASSFAEHIEEGLKFVPLYLHMPLQIGFPLLLLAAVAWKKKRKEDKPAHAQQMVP